ncbi:MAG: hypothetical protein WCK59_02385 [Candidatus Falkowbacteria bacterium]
MTMQDFLTKVHDRNVNHEHLRRAFFDLMHPSYAFQNLSTTDREFIYGLILKHRDKLFKNIYLTQTEINHEYYSIWEKRLALGLLENDLKIIKEVLQSFKAN